MDPVWKPVFARMKATAAAAAAVRLAEKKKRNTVKLSFAIYISLFLLVIYF